MLKATTSNEIRKNGDNTFQFLTSEFACWAVMTRSQFETLIGELDQLAVAPPIPRRSAHFPPFDGLYGTLRICIVKEGANEYRLIANWRGDCLCILTHDEFELLLWKLRRLRDNDPNQDPFAYFPNYTYTITG